jgi:methylmalonyl-CoA mutase cobalamin-binding subunit
MYSVKSTPELVAAMNSLSDEIQRQLNEQGLDTNLVHMAAVMVPTKDGRMSEKEEPVVLGSFGPVPELFQVCALILHQKAAELAKSDTEQPHVH